MEPSQRPPAESRSLCDRATALLDLRRPAEALRMAAAAAAWAPDDPTILCTVARAHVEIGASDAAYVETGAAIAAARAAVRAAPDREWPHRLHAIAILQDPRWHPGWAVGPAEEAFRLAPHAPAAHEILVRALMRVGRNADAILIAHHCVQVAPEQALSHLLMSQTLLPAELLGPAEWHIDQAARLDPANAAIHNQRGAVYLGQWRRREAVTAFGLAAAIDPLLPAPRANLQKMMRYDRFPFLLQHPAPWVYLFIRGLVVPFIGLSRRQWYRQLPHPVRTELFHQRWENGALWGPRLAGGFFLVVPVVWLTQKKADEDWIPLLVLAAISWTIAIISGMYLAFRVAGSRRVRRNDHLVPR